MIDHQDNIGVRMLLRGGTVTDTPLEPTRRGGTHCLTARCGGKHYLWSREGWWGNIGHPTALDLIEPVESKARRDGICALADRRRPTD